MPFGLAIVNKEDYQQLIRQNNGMAEKIEALETIESAKVLELQAKLDLQSLNISNLQAEWQATRRQKDQLQADYQTAHDRYTSLIVASGASEQALQHALETLRVKYDEQVEQSRATIAELRGTLEERDAELQRSVSQATSLGYDNELLRKANEDLVTELEAVKRSEGEKWTEAMVAQGEVIRLKAEIEALKPKVKPAPKRGRRNG